LGDECRVFLSSGVASFLDGVVHLLEGPWLIIKGNRDTMGFETCKESTGWMWKVLEVGL